MVIKMKIIMQATSEAHLAWEELGSQSSITFLIMRIYFNIHRAYPGWQSGPDPILPLI